MRTDLVEDVHPGVVLQQDLEDVQVSVFAGDQQRGPPVLKRNNANIT